jgi:hypothetical protein
LPVAPRKRKRQIAVISAPPNATSPSAPATPVNVSVPKFANIRNIATRNPKSPIRFTTNAFFPASALAFSLNQNPISRYEQSPTPSQPTNMSG